MNGLEMIRAYLEQHGFDGLFSPGECACLLEDLAPCEADGIDECVAGYKHPGDEEYDFFVREEKADETLAAKEPIKEKEG